MSGLRQIPRCDWPRLVSTRREDVELFDKAFAKINCFQLMDDCTVTRWRLWRFPDGSFAARALWRRPAPPFATMRLTTVGDNLCFLRCAPGLAL